MQANKRIRVFEAFAGYGSTAIAMKRLRSQFPADVDFEFVGVSEIEPSAIKAYTAIHGECRNYGDISKIEWSQVPDFDLLTYSSPCQDFSQAGKQAGAEEGSGTRSSLLWECRSAILAKKPKYLLFENVAAVVSKKFKPLFLKWVDELESYGYSNFYQLLNSKDFCVPQNRLRIFMVSILKDSDDENPIYNFPQTMPLTRCVEDIMEPVEEVPNDAWIDPERVTNKVVRDILDQSNVYEELLWRYHVEEASRRLYGRSDFDFMMEHYDELKMYATETLGAVYPD